MCSRNILSNLVNKREITLTKDIKETQFVRYQATIPEDIDSAKIVALILEENTGAPAGYSISDNLIITAFYFNYRVTETRKCTIVYIK